MPPERAVSVWLTGHTLSIEFPDRQVVDIPIEEIGRLLTVLRHREQFALKKQRMTVATTAAPCQLQIFDAYKEAQKKIVDREIAERRRKELLEAESILRDAGL